MPDVGVIDIDEAGELLHVVHQCASCREYCFAVMVAVPKLSGCTPDEREAVVALVRHPDQLAAVRTPEGWPNVIEEILRCHHQGLSVTTESPKIAARSDVGGLTSFQSL